MEPRHLSPLLLLGILVLPVLFSWLLRPGYSSSLRAGAFLYAGVSASAGILAFR